jgi:hypothetical protein
MALEQTADADLGRRLHLDGNSIAIVLQHLSGNLKSRFTDFLTSDGEKPWRDRDREFDEPNADRSALLAAWDEAWLVVDQALADVEALGADGFARPITIRQQPLSVAEALLRSVAHLASHAGQIVQLSRTFAGGRWQSLSIPKGGSAAYAQNPTREKGPDR